MAYDAKAMLAEAGYIPASPSSDHSRKIISDQFERELAAKPCVLCSSPRGAADRVFCEAHQAEAEEVGIV